MLSLDWFTEESQERALEIYSSFFPDETLNDYKKGNTMLEDLPHISLEKPVTLSGATIKDFIYHKIQKLLDKEKLTKAEKEQLAYIKKLDIVVNNGILYDLSIDELTAIGYFDENKYVYDEH